jgi:hypothetical protein
MKDALTYPSAKKPVFANPVNIPLERMEDVLLQEHLNVKNK